MTETAPTTSATTILIADGSKASLVMSSEVFKDKIPGARVIVATSGKDCIELANSERPDMIVVDFDLPDADGASVVALLRKRYQGPIVMTAYPSQEVSSLVSQDLFAYNDCGSIITKPVNISDLNARIDQFLLHRFRIDRRFDVALPSELRKKITGRGSRAPKFSATITNISIGGLSCEISMPVKFSNKDELQIVLPKTLVQPKKKALATAKTGNKSAIKPKAKVATKSSATDDFLQGDTFQLTGRIAWQSKKSFGIRFEKITDKNRQDLEGLLRALAIAS